MPEHFISTRVQNNVWFHKKKMPMWLTVWVVRIEMTIQRCVLSLKYDKHLIGWRNHMIWLSYPITNFQEFTIRCAGAWRRKSWQSHWGNGWLCRKVVVLIKTWYFTVSWPFQKYHWFQMVDIWAFTSLFGWLINLYCYFCNVTNFISNRSLFAFGKLNWILVKTELSGSVRITLRLLATHKFLNPTHRVVTFWNLNKKCQIFIILGANV